MARFAQVVRVVAEREAEEAEREVKWEVERERSRWRCAAFMAYQAGAQWRKEPVSFDRYLRQIGLADLATTPEASDEDLEAVKERALAIGADIVARDKARI